MAPVKCWFRIATRAAGAAAAVVLAVGSLAVFAATPAADEVPALTPNEAAADSRPSDAAQLAARLQGMGRFAATFTQAIAGSRGQVLEESTGYVLLDRPKFKWVVDDPYPQVIVTEGDMLKVYDPDLEQLTIRPLESALKDTPISLLTRDSVDLSRDFLVLKVPEEAAETYVVSPVGDDTLFAEIRLAFSAAGLSSLGILDHLGQYTEIRFRADPNRVIQSADFELEVPPDTDVIGG